MGNSYNLQALLTYVILLPLHTYIYIIYIYTEIYRYIYLTISHNIYIYISIYINVYTYICHTSLKMHLNQHTQRKTIHVGNISISQNLISKNVTLIILPIANFYKNISLYSIYYIYYFKLSNF